MSVPQNILVPIIASEASLEAVTVAALIAKGKKGRVYVAHIIEVNRSLPLNAELEAEARRGEQLIRRAEELAMQDAGYPVTGTLFQAREAGPAIIEEALDHEIDAIIVGVGQAVVGRPGRTIDYLLQHATCSVWVVRQSLGPRKPQHHE